MALAIKLFVNELLSPSPPDDDDDDDAAPLGDNMGDFISPLLFSDGEINAVISRSESFALRRRWCCCKPCEEDPNSTSSRLLLFLIPLAALVGERMDIPVEFMVAPMDIVAVVCFDYSPIWRRVTLNR